MKKTKTVFLFAVGVFCLFAVGAVSILLLLTPDKRKMDSAQAPSPVQSITKPSPDAVGKAGEEVLYSEDLEYEMSLYPASESASVKAAVTNKMIRDSVLLQAARDEGAISLDEKVFNARNKNYRLRLRLVDLARKNLEERIGKIKGTGVVLWYQNGTPGEAGYDQGRQLALDKITTVQRQVQLGNISIDEAIQEIEDDDSLLLVDTSYKTNARLDFNVPLSSPITIDPEVDTTIKKLKKGQLSQVLEGKDVEPGILTGKRESFFVFAQVQEKSESEYASYDEWYQSKLKKYETALY